MVLGSDNIAAYLDADGEAALDELMAREDVIKAAAVFQERALARRGNTRKTFDSGAVRDSTGKLRYDLIPPEHARELAKVLTMGANKYSDRNWEKGIPFSELYASAARHMAQWLEGEERDDESGLLHISHVCWNVMAIETMILRGKGDTLDDLTARGRCY